MATIFKIWSKNSDDVYIGCTRTDLAQRLAEVKAKPPKAAINMMRQGDLCIDTISNTFIKNKADKDKYRTRHSGLPAAYSL